MELWELVVFSDNGPAYSILGDEVPFKAELDAWRQYQEQSAQEFEEHKAEPQFLASDEPFSSTLGFDVRVIEGFSHEPGQMPALVAYRLNEVQAMTIRRVS